MKHWTNPDFKSTDITNEHFLYLFSMMGSTLSLNYSKTNGSCKNEIKWNIVSFFEVSNLFTVLWITACLQLFVWGRNSKEYFSFYFVHNTHLCTVGKQSFGRFAMCYAQFEITRLEPNYRSKWLQRNDEIRMLVKDGVCARVLCARVCVYIWHKGICSKRQYTSKDKCMAKHHP